MRGIAGALVGALLLVAPFAGPPACVAAAASVATAADAAKLPTPIAVSAPAGVTGCPDAVALARATNEAMHRPTLAPHALDEPAAGVTIVVEFAHSAAGFGATIRVLGGERAGVRTLGDAGPTCSDLGQAVAVTLAVMLDEGLPPPAPSTAGSSASSASAASSSASSAPSARPPALAAGSEIGDATPPARPTPVERTTRLDAGASIGAALGIVRTAAPYLSIGLDVAFARGLRVGIAGLTILPQRFDEPGGGSVTVSALAAELFGCARVGSGAGLDVALCAELVGGGIRGRTDGLATNGDRTRPWLAGGALGRLDGRLVGPLGWTVRGSALLQRPRETFAVEGAGPVYEPGILAYFVGVGVSATIW